MEEKESVELRVSNFEQSDAINEIASALSLFQGSVDNAKKDSENPFFHSKYASLENVITTIRKPLSENGLSFCQIPIGEGQLITMLMHKSGQYLKGVFYMKPKDISPQAIGSVLTYMRRYTISAMAGIATEDDDDGNLASTEDKKKATKKATKEETDFMKDLEPTDEEIILHQEKLESAKDLKELKSIWATIPPVVQEKLSKVKDDLKFKLV